jgi:maltodextrin utilization protein YvdJ
MYTIEQGKKFLIMKNVFKLVDDETYKTYSNNDTDTDTDTNTETETKPQLQSETVQLSSDDTTTLANECTNDIEIVECNYNGK